MPSDQVFTLGHSPDPDDAFMFYAMAENKIDLRGYRFEHRLEDIQTLNERALRGELHISAISIHAFAYVSDRYALLPCGASMGDGYGPMLVAKQKFSRAEILTKKIAVPGKLTTAYLALELRAGGGAKYQMLAFPLQRKVQLIKITAEGSEYLAIQKDVTSLMGINKANALRLRVLKPAPGQAQLSAYVGGELVSEATDETAGDLSGTASSVAVGATKTANGVIASIDDVVVRVPVAF